MQLTTREAQAVLTAAAAKAAEMDVPVNIAVLDARGELKSFLRMDGAAPGAMDIAVRKAKTAVLFEANSEAVWEYRKTGALAQRLELTSAAVVVFAGGVPLKTRAGTILGAIGIAGGAVRDDAQVARAGAAALQKFVPNS
jgi:uncharacterized protein GlcG (DUF336 family)